MAAGGSITTTLNIKINLLGTEKIKEAEARMQRLRQAEARMTGKSTAADKKVASVGAGTVEKTKTAGKTRRKLEKEIGPLSEAFKGMTSASNKVTNSLKKRDAFLNSSRNRSAEANLRGQVSKLNAAQFRTASTGVQSGGMSRQQQQKMFKQVGISDPGKFNRLSESKIANIYKQEEKIRSAAATRAAKVQSRAVRSAAGGAGGGGGGGGGASAKGAVAGGMFGSGAKGDREGLVGRLKSVAEFAVAARVVQTAFSGIAKSISTIVGVDKELIELNRVLATSGQELESLRKSAVATGKEFGNSVTSVLKGFKVFAQQGLQKDEIVKRGAAVSLAENVSTLSTEDAAETVTAGLKVYGSDLGGSAERLIDSFVAVESQNAVTASDMSEVIKRVGIAAKNAGTSFDELNAITTVIQESTRAGGGRISRALKFTFKNIFDPVREKDIKKIGVTTRTSTGDLRNATAVLGDLSVKWAGLNKSQRRSTAIAIAGTRFQNEFMALMENFGKVSKVTAQSQDSVGVATERNAIVMQSMSKRAAKAGASFEGLASSLGGGLAGPVAAGLKAAEKLFDVLTAISEMSFPGLKLLQEATGTAETESTGKVGDLAGNALLTSALFFGGKKLKIKDKLKGLGAPAQTSLAFGGKKKGLVKMFKGIGPMIKTGLSAALKGLSFASIFSVLTGAFTSLAAFITGTLLPIAGPLLLLGVAVAGAVKAFNIMTETAEERDQRTGLNAERKRVKDQVKVFKPLSDSFKTIKKQREAIEESGLDQKEKDKRLEAIAIREKSSQKGLRKAVIDNAEEFTKAIPGLELSPDLDITFKGNDIKENADAAASLSDAINRQVRASDAANTTQKSLNKLRDEKAPTGSAKNVIEAIEAVRIRGLETRVKGPRRASTKKGFDVEEMKEGLLSPTERAKKALEKRDEVGLTAVQQYTLMDKEELAKAGNQLAGPMAEAAINAARGGKLGLQIAENQIVSGGIDSDKEVKLREKLAYQRIIAAKRSGKELTTEGITAVEDEIKGLDVDRLLSQAFRQALGSRLALTAQVAEERLGDREGRDLAALGKGDKDRRAEELRELPEGTVIKADKAISEKGTGTLVTSGDQVVELLKNGGSSILGKTETVLASVNGVILNFRSVIGDFASIVANLAPTGFGAGTAVLGKDFKSGATTLKDLSNQVAGTFRGTDLKEGAVFNKGLRQFILAAEKKRQKFAEKKKKFEEIDDRDEGAAADLREEQKLVTAASLIAKSAELFGIAAKSVEAASRNFRLFKEQRKIRQKISADPTTDALFAGGFENLQLGRSASELSAQERAQRRDPEAARRLADLQFQQKQAIGQQNVFAAVKDDLKTVVKSISPEDIKAINISQIPNIISGEVGGITGSDDIVALLESIRIPEGERNKNLDIGNARTQILEQLLKSIESAISGGNLQGKELAAEILPIQQSLRAATALEQLKMAADDSQIAFENFKNAGSNLDKALSSRFNKQGSRAQRVFTGAPGGQLSQVPNQEQLNEFQQRRKMANLLSSTAVQQGRLNVFDEQRQRVGPISNTERDARLQDIRLDERRARKAETEQEGKGRFNVRRSQLGQQLGLVRNIKKLNISEQFNKEIEKIELRLANIQTKSPSSFFTRTGKFSEGSFGALGSLSKDLEKSFQSLSLGEVVKKFTPEEIIKRSEQLGDDKSKKALEKLVGTGVVSDKDLAAGVQKGLINKEQLTKEKEAKFEPIVSILGTISGNVATIVGLMKGEGTGAAVGGTSLASALTGTNTAGQVVKAGTTSAVGEPSTGGRGIATIIKIASSIGKPLIKELGSSFSKFKETESGILSTPEGAKRFAEGDRPTAEDSIRRLFPVKKASADTLSGLDTLPGTGIESITNQLGQNIRGTRLTQEEADRINAKATETDSLTGTGGRSEFETLQKKFGSDLGATAGSFVPLDFNPFPGTGFSPFLEDGKPTSGGQIFRDAERTGTLPDLLPTKREDVPVDSIQAMSRELSNVNSKKKDTDQKKRDNNLEVTAKSVKEGVDLTQGRVKQNERGKENNKITVDGSEAAAAIEKAHASGADILGKAIEDASETTSKTIAASIVESSKTFSSNVETAIRQSQAGGSGAVGGADAGGIVEKINAFILEVKSDQEASSSELQSQKEKVDSVESAQQAQGQEIIAISSALETTVDDYSSFKDQVKSGAESVETHLNNLDGTTTTLRSDLTQVTTEVRANATRTSFV